MLELLLHSAAARELFNDTQSLQAMLDFESALARAEASIGIIPQTAADTITACCSAELFDYGALAEGVALSGNLAIPMVKQLTALVRECSTEAARFVHWGATSQDAIDTGLVLQLRKEFVLLETQLATACEVLAALTREHRNTIMAGRTWLQQAVPITFGLKLAGYLDVLLRHRERLAELKPRTLVLQFGGAAGTLASLGSDGLKIGVALADGLQLQLPALPWHSHRDRVAEVATFHGLLTGTLGKIARDLSLLTQTEISETAEPTGAGRGGSSTMPHKRNPVAAAAILSAAVRVPGLVSTMLSAMVQEHERGLGGWHAEWETLPEICTLTLGALEKLSATLEGLDVFPAAMRDNLEHTHGLLFAEALSMELARTIGKDQAHKKIEAASHRTIATNRHLREVIADDAELMQTFTSEQLDRLFEPRNYLGETQAMIDRVLTTYEAQITVRKEA